MDRIDRKLLNLLQRDASRTNVDMADEVGLSPSSCLRRVRRLRKAGIVDRIVAILNPAKTGRVLKALVTVELKLHGEQHMRRFLDLAIADEAVSQAYAVTGETDIVLMLRLRDMEEFDALCDRLFRDKTNVARFFTMMMLLSVATILGAGLLAAVDLVRAGNATVTTDAVFDGILAFLSAWAAIGFLMRWLRSRSCTPFAVYRVLLGAIL